MAEVEGGRPPPTGISPDLPRSLPNQENLRRDVDRVVMFSDAVFAIAITLLVLSLQVPDVADKDLGKALNHLGPQLLSYALTFLVVGQYWMAHHRTFRSLIRVDRIVLWINLVLLALVALLPFPSEILGRYDDTTRAVVIYALSMLAVGFVAALLWWYVNHAKLAAPLEQNLVRLGIWRSCLAPAIFALSIPISFLSPSWAERFWILILPANLLVERRYGKDAYNY
jgi:uncharacterized membrane protein